MGVEGTKTAYGDKNFAYVISGSTATSAATAHNLFGLYQGLSLLGQDEAVFIQVFASAADIRLSGDPTTSATNNTGLRLTTAGSNYDLPPMRVGDASQISFAREASNNASPIWTVWRRRP